MRTANLLVLCAVLLLPACGVASAPSTESNAEVAFVTATTTAQPAATQPESETSPLPPPELSAATATLAPAIVQATEPPPTDTPSPEPTSTPTETPTSEPTLTPTPDIDWTTVSERTPEGLMSLGNPNAPVTFIDYSDFL